MGQSAAKVTTTAAKEAVKEAAKSTVDAATQATRTAAYVAANQANKMRSPAGVPFKLAQHKVDLQKYKGLWYITHRIPLPMEPLHNETERYTLRQDGKYDVEFKYTKDGVLGEEVIIKQLLWPINEDNTLWNHQMLGPVPKEFGIWEFDHKTYHWSVVGATDLSALYFLSRNNKFDNDLHNIFCPKLKEIGFDTDKMQPVEHKMFADI